MKQKMMSNYFDNIKSLSAKKKLGQQVGSIKYKSNANIPLKQYGSTYHLNDDLKYLKLQGSELYFKLDRNKAFRKLTQELGFSGMSLNDLIESKVLELANAEVIKKNKQYKFNLTVFINQSVFNQDAPLYLTQSINKKNVFQKSINIAVKLIQDIKEKKLLLNKNVKQYRMNLTQEQRDLFSQTCVGIDAGIADELTLNFGELKYSISVNSRENILLKTLEIKIKKQHGKLLRFIRLSKARNNGTYLKSKQYYEIKNLLNRYWDKYENIKDNMTNHIVSFLSQFKNVYFQDEMISKWHTKKSQGFSKKIQSGILGRVYRKLKAFNLSDPEKYQMLTAEAMTTKTCVCGKINNVSLAKRIYKCLCGYQNDRDTHSAFNMISMQVSGRDSLNLEETTNSIKTNSIYTSALTKLASPTYKSSVKRNYIIF